MKQLLIIAKDPTLPTVAAQALSDVLCGLTTVTNAEQALDALSCQRFDLIFLDLEGLGDDGLVVLQALRAHNNPVPVFVAPPHQRDEMAPLRAAAGRGIYYETMTTPVAPADIRAATTAALAIS